MTSPQAQAFARAQELITAMAGRDEQLVNELVDQVVADPDVRRIVVALAAYSRGCLVALESIGSPGPGQTWQETMALRLKQFHDEEN